MRIMSLARAIIHTNESLPLPMNLSSLPASLNQEVLGLPLYLVAIFTAMLGAIIGSFLNVVIHRLPAEESVVFPGSKCPECGSAIKAWDNVPVLSFLVLRGRCRSCGIKISSRYVAVELLTGIAFIAVLYHEVSLRGTVTFSLFFDLAFVAALIALIFIDAEHMILPNAITYPGIAIALIARALLPFIVEARPFDDLDSLLSIAALGDLPLWAVSVFGGVLGALVGGGSLWLMGWLWEKFRGVEAMGLGDVKMMFMVGAYVGFRLAILSIFIAVIAGSITGVLLMLRRGERNLQMLLPFGIFLGIGSIAALLIGSRIIDWYLGQFSS